MSSVAHDLATVAAAATTTATTTTTTTTPVAGAVAERGGARAQWRVYIDGGCTNNHVKQVSARRAGCGIYVDNEAEPSPPAIAPTTADVNRALPATDCRYVSERLPSSDAAPATNNRAELLGAVRALELLVEGRLPVRAADTVTFVLDSKYVLTAITDWLPRLWRPNDYRKADGDAVMNADLVRRLDALLLRVERDDDGATVRWAHVNSHCAEPVDRRSDAWRSWHGNAQADRLANLACGRVQTVGAGRAGGGGGSRKRKRKFVSSSSASSARN